MLPEDVLRSLVKEEDVEAFRRRALTPDAPVLRGTAQNPDSFFQAREACTPFHAAIPAAVEETLEEFGRMTGRFYRLFEYEGDPEAERVVILMGSGAETANRFYQPDLDPEELEVKPTLQLSDSYELRLRLRWLAILSATLPIELSASGGVHTGVDAIKAVMAGATTVQMVSVLLRQGPGHFSEILRFFERWLEEHDYESLSQLRGSMKLGTCPDPSAYERANYLKILQSWGGRLSALES